MNDETGKRVLEILADETGEAVTADSAIDSLGMDSLDYLDAIVRLEAEFEVEIPEAAAVEFETAADLIQWLEAACA